MELNTLGCCCAGAAVCDVAAEAAATGTEEAFCLEARAAFAVKTGTSSSPFQPLSSSVMMDAERTRGCAAVSGADSAAEADDTADCAAAAFFAAAACNFSTMPCLLMPAPSFTPISLAKLRSSNTLMLSKFSLMFDNASDIKLNVGEMMR